MEKQANRSGQEKGGREMVKRKLVLLVASLALGASGWAGEKGHVEVVSRAQVEVEMVNEQGEKEVKLVKAEKVLPGTVVVYTVDYRNTGAESADNIVITNPVPEHMLYVGGSAEGREAEITFSVDRGQSFANAQDLRIIGPDGLERPALASDYTHVRWQRLGPLLASEAASVSFRAQLQ